MLDVPCKVTADSTNTGSIQLKYEHPVAYAEISEGRVKA